MPYNKAKQIAFYNWEELWMEQMRGVKDKNSLRWNLTKNTIIK